MRKQMGLALLSISMMSGPTVRLVKGAEQPDSKREQIVFVCEHGAALSVVSAAYFNKLAREQHLNLHAIARGATPQKDLSVSARQGLEQDGVRFETKRPQRLSSKDAAQARRIIAFCPLPPKFGKLAPVETWSDVPATADGYAVARDAILRHLKELIRELSRER